MTPSATDSKSAKWKLLKLWAAVFAVVAVLVLLQYGYTAAWDSPVFRWIWRAIWIGFLPVLLFIAYKKIKQTSHMKDRGTQ